jgi:hypothetical protein
MFPNMPDSEACDWCIQEDGDLFFTWETPRWDEPTGPEDSNQVPEDMGMHPELRPDAIGMSAHQLLDPAFPRE